MIADPIWSLHAELVLKVLADLSQPGSDHGPRWWLLIHAELGPCDCFFPGKARMRLLGFPLERGALGNHFLDPEDRQSFTDSESHRRSGIPIVFRRLIGPLGFASTTRVIAFLAFGIFVPVSHHHAANSTEIQEATGRSSIWLPSANWTSCSFVLISCCV